MLPFCPGEIDMIILNILRQWNTSGDKPTEPTYIKCPYTSNIGK